MRQATTTMNGNGRAPTLERPRVQPAVARQRRPLRALALVMVAALCAGGFALMFSRAGQRQPVLVIARTVPTGVAISGDDLTVVRLSADSRLHPIPVSARAKVVGHTANSTLVAGTVLTESHFGERAGPKQGESIVAVQLKGARGAPPSVSPGDRVQIVLVASGADASRADPASSQKLGTVMGEGRVLAVDRPRSSSDNAATVSLIVAETLAPTVSGAASAERLTLVVVGRGQ